MTASRPFLRVLRWFVIFALSGVLALGGLFGLLWLEHRSRVPLPTPPGAFRVGREIQDWTDSATVDTLAPVPGAKRELLVWIWYPAAGGGSAVLDEYFPTQLRPKARDKDAANIWTLL